MAVVLQPAKQLLHALNDERLSMTLRPVIDAPAVGESIGASLNKLGDFWMGCGRGFQVGHEGLTEVIHGVKPADVGRFQRTRYTEAAAKARTNDRVDGLGAGNSARPKGPGLAKHCKLQTITDKASNLPLDQGRFLTDLSQHIACPADHVRGGFGAPANLDQGNELRGIPEMTGYDPVAVLDPFDQGAGRLATR